MDMFEAIRTTRAMRRLDPTRPVSDDDVWTVVEAANKAPSGANEQPVRWLVITDQDKRRQLGEIYQRCWAPVRAMYDAKAPHEESMERILRSANYLGDHMGDAPVIIIPCSRDNYPSSVFPALQNLFLAARALGLGTALTTVHRQEEAAVMKVLGIPEGVITWAMVPMGYPLGRWGEAVRQPVEQVTYWDEYESTRVR